MVREKIVWMIEWINNIQARWGLPCAYRLGGLVEVVVVEVVIVVIVGVAVVPATTNQLMRSSAG